MFNTKIRSTIIALVASAGFGGAALVPAASQAQWHNYCVAGHCTEHKNFTIGGTSPCEGLKTQLGTASGSLGDAKTQSEKQAAEGLVHSLEIELSFYGCDTVAPQTSTPSGTIATGTVTTVGTLQAPTTGGTTVSPTPVLVAPTTTTALL